MKVWGLLFAMLMLSGCAGHQYKDYAREVTPESVEVFDTTGGDPEAATIYGISRPNQSFVGEHQLILFSKVDDNSLPNAQRGGFLGTDVTGYQAIKVLPGEHKLSYFFVSAGYLTWYATDLEYPRMDFEPKGVYVVDWAIRVSNYNTGYVTKTLPSVVRKAQVRDFDFSDD